MKARRRVNLEGIIAALQIAAEKLADARASVENRK